MACCMKRTEINMPKSSPASLVNLEIIVQALNIARRNSRTAVQTQTLRKEEKTFKYKMSLTLDATNYGEQ